MRYVVCLRSAGSPDAPGLAKFGDMMTETVGVWSFNIRLPGLYFAVFVQESTKGTHLKSIYENSRWGYADRSGKVIIAAQFDAARPFTDDLAQVGVVDSRSAPRPKVLRQKNLRDFAWLP